ncbi:bifunctional cobalt-precorrin-7 (C(5))-methyltransferase/cobalt-precorrin-6B (C(15))-methyltransferase [Desulfocurvibacter africanus]|uniref:Precorrin-6y C5,15-methyltransferase (Decarboxylating), CbiE subunit n=2 Tax=Desulfocurvibacter africanus TaxID=873 RepID=F3Z2R0_DESAF|nr:bifunctional cobalt-precorrin-7 (C(5))-methyltransferase/cobalt-precorrin-6B (C(15))-methyltransferase [Desulfocurvibacter africanus]EGJ50227.1 precorrin-6y C5,15-methyltransferase (decarboxylating), CbiE subunit [Desulfocurvibacter africanus subsp. africanus str. Walvis Bay]
MQEAHATPSPQPPVEIIGAGLTEGHMCRHVYDVVRKANVLVGGRRMLARYLGHPAQKIEIVSPLSAVIEAIERNQSLSLHVVVLADGDPLFFGIGRRLVEALGADKVRIHPGITALQAAAARLKIAWEDIPAVSLHGRSDWIPLFAALSRRPRVAVYTDATNTPAAIARRLLERGAEAFGMHVLENLHEPDERVGRYTLTEAASLDFAPLNLVILECERAPELPLRLGLPEESLSPGGLITKAPVRAASLAALSLPADGTLWDLGAGSGAVSIEAAVLMERGRILAVERDAGRMERIRENIRRTHAFSVEPVQGDMTEAMASLPDPDRVFFGGGLSRDTRPLELACARLVSGGILVANLVLLDGLSRAKAYLDSLGWETDVTQLSCCRSKPLAGDMRLEGLNPVFILRGVKP